MPKPTGKKSNVWKFFTVQGNNNCICNLCGRSYKTGGGTTNLKNHLIHKHPTTKLSCIETDLRSDSESTQKENDPPRKKQKTGKKDNDKESTDCVGIEIFPDSDSDLGLQLHPSLDSELELSNPPSPDINQRRNSSSSSSNKTSSWIQPTIDVAFKEKQSYDSGGSKEAIITQALLFLICKDNIKFNRKGGF
ncbi:hypothetical protein ABEB36_009632 [Hypothenemus hampei]|uniref:BED-type domain-containing protein n=1 Tax=Hypothenemus hampei TaxID=57062 RepID=A0ABD1EGX8_HYPHA